MKSIFLFTSLFFTLFFLNFTIHHVKNTSTKTVQNKSISFVINECEPRYITVHYSSSLSFTQINAIRNYYITEYSIELVPTLTVLTTTPSFNKQSTTQCYISETWYVNAPCGHSRPGNGGIHKEIDEDPDLSPGYFDPNSM